MATATPPILHTVIAGHLGHLTPEQEAAFENFKDALSKANLYRPATDTRSASHDDATVL
jgi:hypothetical protein